MNKVAVDKKNMTVTAQGGSLARDLEGPAYGLFLHEEFGRS